MKLSKVLIKFLEAQEYVLKQRTILYYYQIIKIYIEGSEIDVNIETINNEMLNAFALRLSGQLERDKFKNSETDKNNFSFSTIKVIKSLVARGMVFAKKRGWVKESASFEVVIKPNSPRRVESLSKDEQAKIENYILGNKKVYSYGVLISLYTGLRIGELLSLKWESVDLKAKTLIVKTTTCKIADSGKIVLIEDLPKTQSSVRELPITKVVVKLLKDIKACQKGASEYVMARANGKRIDMRTYQDSFSRLLRRLEIRHYGFHALRHTFATRCLELGIDIKTISELMGHANPTITLNRYVHTNLENKRQAVNLLARKINQRLG